jgi:putative ABC transport system permease protein
MYCGVREVGQRSRLRASPDRWDSPTTRAAVRERHHVRKGQEAEFNLRHPTEIAQTRVVSQRTIMLILASVVAVALVVGGIGIMNIMLVSVTE